MKKIIAIIMAAIMLLSLCACGKDTENDSIGIIGGADGPTVIVVGEPSDDAEPSDDTEPSDNTEPSGDAEPSDNTEPTDDAEPSDNTGSSDDTDFSDDAATSELPERVEWEEIFIGGNYGGFYRIFTAYAEDGSAMWTYRTGNSMAAQLETLEYIGMYDGLVYINEQALYDEELNAEGMVEVYGRLRALDAKTGEVVWDNTDYDGGSSAWDFDEEGNLYIGGYFGPDCMKIGTVGETIWKVDSADSDAYWMYSLEYKDGEIALSYEMNDFGEEETVIISAENGDRLR